MQVERQREDDRRVLVDPDLGQGLEVAQLERAGRRADHLGGVAQPLRRLELALRVDHLGAALALGLRLAGHRALHAGRDLHVLDLDGGDLHAPRVGLLVDDLLERVVEPLAVGQQHVEVGLAEHGAQRRLGDLRSVAPR